MQDNTMRQNIPNLLGYYGFTLILGNKGFNVKLLLKLAALTGIGFLFHYSAILLLLFFFLVNCLRKTSFNLKIVFPLVVFLSVIRFSGILSDVIRLVSIGLTMIGSDYGDYYVLWFDDQEFEIGGFKSSIYMLMSLAPLIYFKMFSPQRYKNDEWLKLSVNLTIIWVCWTEFLMLNILTRMVTYFTWFMIWGYGYMIHHMLSTKKKKELKLAGLATIMIVFIYYEGRQINEYFGDNNYMTVFTDECQQFKTYQRLPNGEDLGTKRVRYRKL